MGKKFFLLKLKKKKTTNLLKFINEFRNLKFLFLTKFIYFSLNFVKHIFAFEFLKFLEFGIKNKIKNFNYENLKTFLFKFLSLI